MPLRRKLLLSMLIPALLLGFVGVFGLFSLRHLEQAAGRILSDNYQSIQEARSMSRALLRLETPEYGSPFEKFPKSVHRQAIVSFEQALKRCEANITETGEMDIIRRIRRSWESLRPLLDSRFGPNRSIVQADIGAFRDLHDEIEAMVSINEESMTASERESRHVARVMRGALTISTLVALAALVIFAMVSANRIARPVTEVADRLHQALNPAPEAGPDPAPKAVSEIERLRQELFDLLARLRKYEDKQNLELSNMQARLGFVINEVLEGLVLVDAKMNIVTANRVGRTMLDLAEGEKGNLADLNLREDVRQILAPVIAGSFQSERDLGEFCCQIEGDERVFRPRLLTVPATSGAIEGYLILFWDVTEQRRFEESRRRFISMLSHQLNTPMTSLSMSVNLLREKMTGLNQAQAELLAIAGENCNNLSNLVADLIVAAKEVTPDLALKLQRVDIVRLLKSALRPLIPQAREKGIEICLPEEANAAFAQVDPIKFPWVVTNIVGNAMRYTDPGGRIEVTVLVDDGFVEVGVRDTGTGIEPENLERIFQPYVSLESDPEPGTHGLGLAIAREVVEAHRGEITASCEPDQGTRFKIRLPNH